MSLNTNLLQPTGFKISINRSIYPTMEFFVQSVDHGSVSCEPGPEPYSRIGGTWHAGDKLEFSEITFNMLLDESMEAYTEMYDWMKRLVETKSTTPMDGTTDRPSDAEDITLSILTSANTVAKTIIYKDCIPTLLGNFNMEAGAGDVPVLVYPISFRYTYFDIQ